MTIPAPSWEGDCRLVHEKIKIDQNALWKIDGSFLASSWQQHQTRLKKT